MKESIIRQVFKSYNFPFKATAFHKLITFIVEGLSVKTNISTTQKLSDKVNTLQTNIDTKANSSALEDLVRRVEALEQKP